MEKRIGKKGFAFDLINKGMIAFIGFVLIALLVILLVSTLKQTSIVCDTGHYDTATGTCLDCNEGDAYVNLTSCCNATTGTPECSGTNRTDTYEYGSSAYNGTKQFQEAADLPPQFGEIIVIVLVIVGILGMLSMLGYGIYKRMKR